MRFLALGDLTTKYSSTSIADDYECPTVITDKSHGSCGQSRFGCWVCTVVKDDKSMRSLIKNGREWMQPLYDFQDNTLELNKSIHS